MSAATYAGLVSEPSQSSPSTTDAYFERVGDGVYRPTLAASGAWRRDEQHMAATSALMAHEIGRHEPRPDMQIGRITYEILGVIPLQDTEIRVETVRPGRTIELLEATATIAGRVALRARVWRLSVQDTGAYAGLEMEPMPRVEDCTPDSEYDLWDNPGYTSTMQLRVAPGGRAGRRRGWLRPDRALITGETAHPLGDFMLCVDGANGLATRVHPRELMYPNVELTVHFLRAPETGWVGLDTAVSFGASGLGLTATVLNDERGVVGVAHQELTVREFPAG